MARIWAFPIHGGTTPADNRRSSPPGKRERRGRHGGDGVNDAPAWRKDAIAMGTIGRSHAEPGVTW
ncbi:MAG: hypothetical protein ACLT8E_00405 [Akkermansia sp.]